LAAAHVDDSELGGDHTTPPAPTTAPVACAPAANVPVPATAPRSAGQAVVVQAPSKDHPPTITPLVAVPASMKLQVSLAAV
jgi:hypothetical protein